MHSMNQLLRPLRLAAAGLAFCTLGMASTAHAAIALVANRAALSSPQVTVDWSTIGPDGTAAGASPSSGGVTVTGARAFTVFQQAPTGTWNGDFADGESALVMFDANSGNPTDGSFEIDLGGSWGGFGLQLGALINNVAWEVDVSVFDSSNTLVAQFDNLAGMSTDAGDGSAYFLGAVSNSANMARIVITGLGEGGAINQITLVAQSVPAPATLALTLLSLGLLAGLRRRHA